MSTRNLSGTERPSRSSSVSSRIFSISSRSLTRLLSCQRQSFHFSSGTSSQIGARRLTAGAPFAPSARAGSARLTNGASAAVRAASWWATAVLISCASTRASLRFRAWDRTNGRLRRIKSMQSACGRMIARWSRGGLLARWSGESNDPGTDRGRRSGDGSRSYSPITAQRKPIMMKKPLNRAIRPIPP